jgi:hypothetical protein
LNLVARQREDEHDALAQDAARWKALTSHVSATSLDPDKFTLHLIDCSLPELFGDRHPMD